MTQCCICKHYIASLACKHCDKTQDTMLSQMRHNEHSLPSQCMLPTANIVTPSTLSFDIQTPYLIRFPIVVWTDDRPPLGQLPSAKRSNDRALTARGLRGCRVERDAPCYRVRPLGLRIPSKRTSPFFGGYPSSEGRKEGIRAY